MKPERFLSEHAEARLSGGIIWEVGFYVRNKIGENGQKRTKKDSTKTKKALVKSYIDMSTDIEVDFTI